MRCILALATLLGEGKGKGRGIVTFTRWHSPEMAFVVTYQPKLVSDNWLVVEEDEMNNLTQIFKRK
jgi:hypothetical protein